MRSPAADYVRVVGEAVDEQGSGAVDGRATEGLSSPRRWLLFHPSSLVLHHLWPSSKGAYLEYLPASPFVYSLFAPFRALTGARPGAGQGGRDVDHSGAREEASDDREGSGGEAV